MPLAPLLGEQQVTPLATVPLVPCAGGHSLYVLRKAAARCGALVHSVALKPQKNRLLVSALAHKAGHPQEASSSQQNRCVPEVDMPEPHPILLGLAGWTCKASF